MKESRGSAIVVALLMLLPMMYVGSYLALVVPSGIHHPANYFEFLGYYRCFDGIAAKVYWPLEQVDRRIRPDAWYGPQQGLPPVILLAPPSPAP